MSLSDSPAPVRLTVAADPGTEIFIVDHAFKLVARAVGHLSADVPPGLYKIRYRVGTLIHEEHVTVAPDAGTVSVRGPALAFASVAPLAGTSTMHEYHRDHAAALSRQVERSLGEGGQLFVFARTWRAVTEQAPDARTVVPPGHHPATGLALHDLEGHRLVDYANETVHDLQAPDPWAGCNVNVRPGPYRLRVDTPRWGPLEQIVVVPSGWQVQIFLFQFECGDDAPVFRPALADASILLSRPGVGFDPSSEALRLAELGRQALRDRRQAAPRVLLNQMLSSKSENPMLGIYAGHALAAAGDADRNLLGIVVGNLRAMLGAHPDVESLALALSDEPAPEPPPSFASPPMLRNSWSILVDRSQHVPALVPQGSLASRMALSVWGDGPWLIWQSTGAEPSHALPEDFVDALVARLSSRRRAGTAGLVGGVLGAAMSAVLGDVRGALRDVAVSLGVPPTTLQDVIGRLGGELGRRLEDRRRGG